MDQSKTDINQLTQQINQYATLNQQLEEQLATLNDNAKSVENVLAVVANIAEQTNLLALNAAIEAARAGEHGRGFSVVADEVRALSTRTQDSLEQISTIIKNINHASDNASEQMTKQTGSLHQVMSVTEKACENITLAAERGNQVAKAVIHLSGFSQELEHQAQNVLTNLASLDDITEQNIDNLDQITNRTAKSTEVAAEIDAMITEFRLTS